MKVLGICFLELFNFQKYYDIYKTKNNSAVSFENQMFYSYSIFSVVEKIFIYNFIIHIFENMIFLKNYKIYFSKFVFFVDLKTYILY